MRFLSSLDRRDRKLLLWCVGGTLALAVLGGFLLPNGNNNENRLPSSYLSGQHGALAAYETLVRSGYPVERWEHPLSELAAVAGPDTVVLFAQPFSREKDDLEAVRHILERGGRVLSTGFWGGYLLPGGASAPPREFNFAACQLEPEGLDPLASSGEVWMIPEATWQVGKPNDRVQYSCAGQPAVVEYNWGNGHVVWWASSTPLENGSLARGHNLDLLLKSLGPRAGKHFYWDESLHGEIRSTWNYAGGPALTVLRLGVLGLALLVLFSFSRRSGPVRDLPSPVRTTPVEFVEALGSLYRNAGAANTAVAVAWERFRREALRLCGMQGERMDAEQLAVVLQRRYPELDETLEADLKSCAEAAGNDALHPREALRLVQLLTAHLEKLRKAARPQAVRPVISGSLRAKAVELISQERAS
ncbi:DUF4350 domain-containing protein [Acidobacteria bacterium AB60]|nr:DUF4350 domain-containing protein [Acidobacteria bacterium AB60]